MRIRSKIWVSIVSSAAVSVVIASFAFSILQDINHELSRSQKYDAIINKAFALNILIATFKEESGRRDIQQGGEVRRSLSGLLEGVSSADPGEQVLLRQISRNNQELGPLLDQFFEQRKGLESSLETQRRNMLATQLWIKVRFITDDTYRLMEISRSRIVVSQEKAGFALLALIFAVILTNAAISFLSGRSIVRDVGRLSEGVKHISGGDLAHRIEVVGSDELADLARAFNGMAASLQASYDRLREYTRKLEQSNRELQEFAYVATHDLQEPLRKIQMFGDCVRDQCADSMDERSRDFLGRAINAARRMQELIGALLQYSRISQEEERYQPMDLTVVVREVIEDLSARIMETHGQIEVGNLPEIEANTTQMRQLFQNLLSNALKYHRPESPPKILVHSRLQDSGNGKQVCEVTVSDNGIGFDERYLGKIFAPFQRLHGKLDYEGTGIGLAICRRIVERHGGTITARSTPGGGSAFILALPVKQENQRPAETAEASPPGSISSTRREGVS